MKSGSSLKVISYTDKAFKDRQESGKLLGKELLLLGIQNAVVLGIPRGGVLVAKEIANMLDVDLDVVLSRKLSAPGNPELAIGAVTEDGNLFIDETIASHVGAGQHYIKEEKARQMLEINRRRTQYRNILPKVPLKERTVIVTDDGIATGATMLATLWAVRNETPKQIIAAIPVATQENLMRVADYADKTLCLRIPSFFTAVGQFYINFAQTEDADVEEILKQEYKRKSGTEE